jgi:hypothetical protein
LLQGRARQSCTALLLAAESEDHKDLDYIHLQAKRMLCGGVDKLMSCSK